MADVSPQAVAAARTDLGVPDERIPRSAAIIMDGNGRWAKQRGLGRSAGHEHGAKVVRQIVSEAARLGLDALTLYSFSIENWRRPKDEVSALMHLYADTLVTERPTIMAHNVRLRHLGRREGLPAQVLRELDESVRVSSPNTGMYLCLALNYSSRAEIIDALRRIALKVRQGQVSPDRIDEELVSNSLDTEGVPDPDLLIRTAGEMRLSNFLLWQISYAELYVTDVYWPDFDEPEFRKAIIAYANRRRRFGGLDATNSEGTVDQ
jgi:undecaprenyl diphosphate synthase